MRDGWRGRENGAMRALPTSRLRPEFLVMGAQKSGTTALHRYLAGQPAVLLAAKKELHYFNNAYGRGEAWYLSHFPRRIEGAIARRRLGVRPVVGEATPAYLFHPRVPRRVHEFDPHLKLIAVLRDPVERAYSQYQMQFRNRLHDFSFEEALACEDAYLAEELQRIQDDPSYVSPTGLRHTYRARGRYAEQLERWLRLFPREQLLVLTREELLEDPAAGMALIGRFLEIPASANGGYPLDGVNSYAEIRPDTREQLAHEFEPHNRRLEEIIGRELHWTRPALSASAQHRLKP
jgi:hypothetical protein